MDANQCTVLIRDFTRNPEEHFEDFLDKLTLMDYELAKVFAFSYFHPVDDDDRIINYSVQDFKKKFVPLFKQYLTSWEIEVSGFVEQTLTN